MPAPTNTYNSKTDLSLGQLTNINDPALYTALLDIHNAIETLLTSSDAGSKELLLDPISMQLLTQLADIREQIGSGEFLTVDDEGITCDDTFMTCDRDEM
jgi:hypothetical protein